MLVARLGSGLPPGDCQFPPAQLPRTGHTLGLGPELHKKEESADHEQHDQAPAALPSQPLSSAPLNCEPTRPFLP